MRQRNVFSKQLAVKVRLVRLEKITDARRKSEDRMVGTICLSVQGDHSVSQHPDATAPIDAQ